MTNIKTLLKIYSRRKIMTPLSESNERGDTAIMLCLLQINLHHSKSESVALIISFATYEDVIVFI